MKPEELEVVVPRKEGMAETSDPVRVWPLIEEALERIEADGATRDAALAAMARSDGIAVLGNYLNSEAKRIRKMDYSFKVPVIVAAASVAREDELADSFYDPQEGCVYFETDTDQFSFHVHKDWTVDWRIVVDEVVEGYDWSGEENQTWALERLLEFLDTDLTPYASDDDEKEDK
jgi:hypothetical protein